jgi:ribosomal protein S14
MREPFPKPAPGKGYTQEQREHAITLAAEIGRSRAANRLGIGYLTLRRWTDAAFVEAEREEKHQTRRAPCEQCGRLTNVYGRKHLEFGLLCRSCLATRLADQKRGWSSDELVDMYQHQLMSTNEIAAMTGATQSGVDALLRRNGVTLRSIQEAIRLHPGGQREHGKVDPNEIKQLYLAGMSRVRIAAEVACSVGNVDYHLTKLGLAKRATN